MDRASPFLGILAPAGGKRPRPPAAIWGCAGRFSNQPSPPANCRPWLAGLRLQGLLGARS